MRTLGMWIGGSLCVLALALTASQVSAANLVANPGFETASLPPWLTFGGGTITVQSPDNGPSEVGTHNAFLDNQTAANATLLKQSTAAGSASAGTAYNYSFDLKPETLASGGVFFVHIFAEQVGGGVLPGGDLLLGPFFPSAGVWTNYNGVAFASAPVGTDFLTIQFEAVTGADAGSISQMHVDNAGLDSPAASVPGPTGWVLLALAMILSGTAVHGLRRRPELSR